MALFWPDLDMEHARGALSQALRYLRRTLAEGVFMSQGEEEIGVDGKGLWCDAPGFNAACEAGELDRAMELYKGPFLDGFFVADASPEYDQWVAEQRAEFRSRAASVASNLSQAAESRTDLATAVQWARRASAITPDDEVTVARLIGLLDRSGDRVGALSTYESLRQRLLVEFRATPSAETQALVARMRPH